MKQQKRAHHSQIVRAEENLKLSHGGPNQEHTSGTDQWMKALRKSKSKACLTFVHFKRKPYL